MILYENRCALKIKHLVQKEFFHQLEPVEVLEIVQTKIKINLEK